MAARILHTCFQTPALTTVLHLCYSVVRMASKNNSLDDIAVEDGKASAIDIVQAVKNVERSVARDHFGRYKKRDQRLQVRNLLFILFSKYHGWLGSISGHGKCDFTHYLLSKDSFYC